MYLENKILGQSRDLVEIYIEVTSWIVLQRQTC